MNDTFCIYCQIGRHDSCTITDCTCTCNPELREHLQGEPVTDISNTAHVYEAVATSRVACPECAKRVKPTGLGIHRAKAHGIPGSSPKTRPRTSREAPPGSNGATPKPKPTMAADTIELVEEYALNVIVDAHERDVLDALGFLEGHGDATGYLAHHITLLVNQMADESDVKLVLTARRARTAEAT